MGLTIDRERFDPQDYRRFERRLDDCLTALERLLERPASGPDRLAAPGPGRLEPGLGRSEALAAMLERYLELQRTGDPVHTWPLP